jgi:hypothetical protein
VAKSDSNGKLTGRPHQKQLQTADGIKLYGAGSAYLDSEASRSTEDEALKRPRRAPRLNKLQKKIMILERIGHNPKYMPDYPTHNRYGVAIYGSALWAWIGRQPGITCTTKDVEAHLKAISHIMAIRAEMGLDDKINEK